MMPRRYKIMKFTTTKLKLPLFMLTRQKLKGNKILKTQFVKQQEPYVRDCGPENVDNEREHATIFYQRHIAGRHRTSLPVPSVPCPRRILNLKRKEYFDGLPPNLYDASKVPFLDRKGFGVKLVRPSVLPTKSQSEAEGEPYKKSYREDSTSTTSVETRKGTFVFNAREAPPTSRMMTMLAGKIEGPPANKYTIIRKPCTKNRALDHSKFKVSNAYRFYPKTKVMVTDTYLTELTKNQSFRPGPGRYAETYGCLCKSSLNKIYEPKLYDMMMKAKAQRVLEIPHKKINPEQYFCPLYQNIKGHGHTRLFKNGKPTELTAEEKQRMAKFHTEGLGRAYINRVLNPKRETISLFPYKEKIKTTIKYNSLERFKKRKTANLKRIAFLSSEPRFKEEDSILPKTKKETFPIRPLVDFPISNIPLDQIKGKLHEERHDQPVISNNYSSTKRPFHFKPLPNAKMLVVPEDYIPTLEQTRGFYTKRYVPDNFFWNATESMSSIVLNANYGV